MAHYHIFIGTDNKHHWNLKSANGEIVCWGEGYDSKQGAEKSIAWVKVNAKSAPIK